MGRKLYIGNLSYTLVEEDVKQAFERSGKVINVKIITDRETGQSRGFAFVEMGSDQEASQALSDWAGSELGGRTLVVKEAQERRNNNGYRPNDSDRGNGYRPDNRGPVRPNYEYGSDRNVGGNRTGPNPDPYRSNQNNPERPRRPAGRGNYDDYDR
jgi:RNA recognition motif-containing protein